MKTLILSTLLLILSSVHSYAGERIFSVEITAKILNVRAEPTSNSRILGSFNRGQRVLASTSKKRTWYVVTINGKRGYISKQYARLLP